MPVQFTTMGIGYNIKMFLEAGIDIPPNSWNLDIFIKYLSKIYYYESSKKKQDPSYRHNFTIQDINYPVPQLVPDLWDYETGKIKKDKKNDFISIHEKLQKMYSYLPAPEEVQEVTGTATGQTSFFIMQKTYLNMTYAWQLIDLNAVKDLEWDITEEPHPGNNLYRGYTGYLALASISKNKDEAYKFMQFYVNQKNADLFSRMQNGMSARISSTGKFFIPPPRNISIYINTGKNHTLCNLRPNLKNWQEFNKKLKDIVGYDFIKGKMSAVKYADIYFQESDKMLEPYKK